MKIKHRAFVASQSGQALTEYIVVVTFCVVALIVLANDSSPLKELLDAIKSFYRAYSYVLSVSA
jgi:Flp pilus assembly pilin Flp